MSIISNYIRTQKTKKVKGWFYSNWRKRQLLEGYARTEVFKAGDLVLDLGCGNGAMGRAVAETFQCKVEGADVVNLLIEDLPFHILPKSWEKWSAQSFDVVMINDALHHMEPDIQTSTLRGALGIGRKVLIFDTRPTLIAKILDVLMGYIMYGGKETIPLTHRDSGAWIRLLEESGCRTTLYDLARPSLLYPLYHFMIVAEYSHEHEN